MTHASKMDKMVWAEYSSAGDELVEEATEVFLNRFDFEEPLSDELKRRLALICQRARSAKQSFRCG